MNTPINLSENLYKRICNEVFQNRYNEEDILKLLDTVHFLYTIGKQHKRIIATQIKRRVNRNIYNKIRNLNNIFEILYELIHISNNYTRTQNRNRF